MPYIDLAGLSRYASRQKERLERDCALLRDMQWTRSEKAGAVSLWPAGGTPLKPVVDFLFSETPPASGDKGPDNPSTITGVSSVNVGRSGKNLILGTLLAQGASSDITYMLNADGSITFNGSVPSDGDHFYLYTFNRELNRYKLAPFLKAGYTYTLHAIASEATNAILYQIYLSISGSVWANPICEAYSGQTKNFTIPENTTGMACRYIVVKGKTVNNVTFMAQLEGGSSATTFEKPEYNTYTLSLGSTYYGGTLDVASGVMTVTHTTVVVNGNTTYSASIGKTETATSYSLAFYPPVSRSKYQGTTDKACNLFSTDGSTNCVAFGNNSYNIRIILEKSLLGLADDLSFYELQPAFQSFFGEHPMTIVYRLETPYTVQLTPTEILSLTQADKYMPRLNTIYTDASAVQVGYIKSPIREEFELQQAVAAQGGNV